MMKWLERIAKGFLEDKGYVVYIDSRKRRRTAEQIAADKKEEK